MEDPGKVHDEAEIFFGENESSQIKYVSFE